MSVFAWFVRPKAVDRASIFWIRSVLLIELDRTMSHKTVKAAENLPRKRQFCSKRQCLPDGKSSHQCVFLFDEDADLLESFHRRLASIDIQ
jgi:hypothetical protein